MADETLSIQRAEQVDHQLVRGIGIPALTANIVSSTIGAGIFVIPATVAAGTRTGRATRIYMLRDRDDFVRHLFRHRGESRLARLADSMPMSKSRSANTSGFSPALFIF